MKDLNFKEHRGFFFAIIIIFIPIFISRIFYLDVAAGADESMYYLLGQETLKGNLPYSTFYEMKPPFLFFNFALVALFTSGSVFSLHLAALFLALLNTFLCFFITNKLLNFEKGAISALVFFTLISSPHLCGPYLLGEHFVLFYLLLSLLFLFNTESFKKVNFFICGVLFGIAVLTKQTAIFFTPLYLFLLSQYFHQEHYLKKLFWFSLEAHFRNL
jgi:4-amino-4-deoxy-L-arabinose transferase-like glycosyltransferase